MFITEDELVHDFLNQKNRALYLKVGDEAFYNVHLEYLPFNAASLFVNELSDIAIPIQFFLFSTPDFKGKQSVKANVYRFDEGKQSFLMQTLQITFIRVLVPDDDLNKYIDLFPSRIDEKKVPLKNVNRYYNEIKSFDQLYPQK